MSSVIRHRLRIIAISLFLVFLLLPGRIALASCAPLILRNSTDAYSLGPYLEILEDKGGTLTIGDVSSPSAAGRFRAGGARVPSFGITDDVYWVKFTLENRSAAKSWLLELDFPHIDYVDLFLPLSSGSYEKKESGEMRPFGVREIAHRNPVFLIRPGSAPQTFYIRAQAKDIVMFPLTLSTFPAFMRADYRKQWMFGLYYGLMVAMGLYNLFLFFVLRDRTYLYYFFYVLTFTFFSLVFNGFAFPVLFPRHPVINHYFEMTVTILTIMSVIVFSRAFLHSARYAPGFDVWLKGLLIASVLLFPGMFFMDSAIYKKLIAAVALTLTFLTLLTGIVCHRRGYYPARFFVVARLLLQLGAMLFILGILGVLPQTFVVRYGMQAGSALDVVLLSIALADRITVLRKEKELAETEAARAGQLASLGELAACVAHEINTPLNTIINSAELLLEYAELKGLEQDAMVIKKEGRRIANIVKTLLSFARQGKDGKIPVAAADILSESLMLTEAQMRKDGIAVRVDIPGDMPGLIADPQQIGQVFLNLISNARYALNAKHHGPDDEKLLEITAEMTTIGGKPYMRISFHDRGSGIPRGILHKVTDPFFTTKPAGAGTGLGLSISRQIIDDHNGSMRIESSEGEYTGVILELPTIAQQPPR